MTRSQLETGGIRALEEKDIAEVARLWDKIFRAESSLASPDTRGFLHRTLLASPWSDSELPSLVHTDATGKIVGFVGSSVRRMTFDERPIRVVCSAHLMIDPSARVQGVGALLLGRLLKGPQDLTTTDNATATTRALWEGLGGTLAPLGSVGWVRIFRPLHVARLDIARRRGLEGSLRRLERSLRRAPAEPAWRLADAPVAYIWQRLFPTLSRPAVDTSTALLTPATAAETLPKAVGVFRLRPDYDVGYLTALFQDLGRFIEGVPVTRLVTSGGRTLGSFVYLLKRGAICPVLQVACGEQDAPAVIGELFEHARAQRAAALIGRIEPHLQEAIARAGVFLFPAGRRRLVHSRDPDLLNAVHSGNAIMTRLDGEWW